MSLTFLVPLFLLGLAGLVGLTMVLGGLFGAVPGGFVPEEDQGYFLVNVQLPDAASLQRTQDVMAEVEEILAEFEAIESYTAISGFSRGLTCTLPSVVILKNSQAIRGRSIAQSGTRIMNVGSTVFCRILISFLFDWYE